jgi:hypothetical protein
LPTAFRTGDWDIDVWFVVVIPWNAGKAFIYSADEDGTLGHGVIAWRVAVTEIEVIIAISPVRIVDPDIADEAVAHLPKELISFLWLANEPVTNLTGFIEDAGSTIVSSTVRHGILLL